MNVKSYSCSSCGGTFKNSASLATHKYTFHPSNNNSFIMTAPKESLEFDRISSSSNISSLDHDLGHMTVDNQMHKFDIETLQSSVRELRSLINKLDTKARLQAVILDDVERYVKRQRMNPGTTTIISPEAVSQMKDQTRNNTHRIRIIEEQIVGRNVQQVEEADDATKQDNLDDMLDVKEMFINNNFEGLKSDIPKLRQSIRFMLDSLDLQKLDEEDVQLLEELRTSSKREVLALLQTKFGHLGSIFNRLKPEFDALFEDDEDSERGMETDDDSDPKREYATNLENDTEETENESEEINSDEETENESEEINSDEETENEPEEINSDEETENEPEEINSDEETDEQSEIESDYQSVVIEPKTKFFGL